MVFSETNVSFRGFNKGHSFHLEIEDVLNLNT